MDPASYYTDIQSNSTLNLSMISCTIERDKQLEPGHELREKEHVHSEPDGKETLIDNGRPTDYIPRPTDMERGRPMIKNMYTAARGHVQRVIDVALLISNMSRMATIVKRKAEYEDYQVHMLVTALMLSMVAQMIAGVCFFITHHRDVYECSPKKPIDYVAFACVGVVMVLNIFISTFDATWAPGPKYVDRGTRP